MTIQMIKNITIENFKCFEKLSLQDVCRVNLIGGKNNVGKTALLEAIELFSNSKHSELSTLATLYNILQRRQCFQEGKKIVFDFLYNNSNFLLIKSGNYDSSKFVEISHGDTKYKIEEQLDLFGNPFADMFPDNQAYFTAVSVNDNNIIVDVETKILAMEIPIDKFMLKDFPFNYSQSGKKNIHYIESSKMDEYDISILYGSLIDLNKDTFVNEALSSFDSNLQSLKQVVTEDGFLLKIQTKNQKYPILLSSLGEGVSRYITILCAIWASENGVLLIDEIENGIHYTNYYKLWALIFSASEQANCQVFATSHSKECIDAFYQVQSDHNYLDEGRYFELYNSRKNKRITAASHSIEQLKYELTHEGHIRGE